MAVKKIPEDTNENFDGKRFQNVPRHTVHGFRAFLKWQFTRDSGAWDKPVLEAEPGQAPPKRVAVGEARVTFVNHSTILIQIDELNILTDPIWATYASPFSWMGPRRHHPPGIRFEDLPPINAVLVSHDHYDHMNMPTLKQLFDKDHPAFYTGLNNGRRFAKAGISPCTELGWWEDIRLNDSVVMTYVPAQHFSSRGAFDHNQTLWGGFVIKGLGASVYFAGDTGAGPHFGEIRNQCGSPDLAILPVGAYRPRWFMRPVHLSPTDAVVAYRQLQARFGMAMHFGTFRLADDGQHEPLEELEKALADSGLTNDDFWVLNFGEGRDLQGAVARNGKR